MRIMDSNNPYANVYLYTDPGPPLAKVAKAAEIQDGVFKQNEAYKDGMRANRFYDSKTSAAQNADQVLATMKAEIGRSANLMKARLHENTQL